MRLDKLTTATRYLKGRSLVQDLPFMGFVDGWFQDNLDAKFKWLDICCGDSRMLNQFKEVSFKNNLVFHGYDINIEFITSSQSVADELDIKHECKVGELPELSNVFGDRERKYHGISIVNALHEIPITSIPRLFLDMFKLVEESGFIFVFDLASFRYEEPEPGAITWRPSDMKKFLKVMERELKFDFVPEVLTYSGEGGAEKAWYFRLKSNILENARSQNLLNSSEIEDKLNQAVIDIFKERLKNIDENIQKFTKDLRSQQNEASLSGVNIERENITKALDIEFRDFWSCNFELMSIELNY